MRDWLRAGSAETAAAFWGSSSLRDSVRQAKTAFCIHNLAYQGAMPLATFPRLCLPHDALPPLLWPPVKPKGSQSKLECFLATHSTCRSSCPWILRVSLTSAWAATCNSCDPHLKTSSTHTYQKAAGLACFTERKDGVTQIADVMETPDSSRSLYSAFDLFFR